MASLNDMEWMLTFYGATYDSTEDLTELTYAVSVAYNSIQDIISIRLQLPCDCLLDECMLRTLVQSSTPSVMVENGQFVWNMAVTRARTYILKLVLHGKFDDSISENGKYALYGERGSCAYGGDIAVPQPCKCWSEYTALSDSCSDDSWYVHVR